MQKYADIVLPLAVPTAYTYLVPNELLPNLELGVLVNVSLGAGDRHYNGIVIKIHEQSQPGIKYKPISSILLDKPLVTEHQINLWNWISSYYMCKMGYVLKVAVPIALFNTTYRSLTVCCVRVKSDWQSILPKNKVTEKQLELINYLQGVTDDVTLSDAQEIVSSAVINLLVKKGIVEKYDVEISRFKFTTSTVDSNPLSPAQDKALKEIEGYFDVDSKPVLLHGVTSSGKTEIYVRLIENAVAEGRQVLLLVPEIALTVQLTKRLEKIFGGKMLVYHSKLNDQERAEVYNEVLFGDTCKIVLGVRSAVFLPFRNLGLVIVDEQHDLSYKQQDTQPLYSAVSCAAVLASMYGAKMVLGSATPSIESYYNSLSGKWHLVSLQTRYNDIQLPEIEVVDMRLERRKNKVVSMFSWTLRDKIINAVAAGEQVILFHNRRGYSSQVHCDTCGWVPKCESCSVSLTYHKATESLECHYCGKKLPMPQVCPVCGGELSSFGYGTEQIEDVLKFFLPEAKVLRLDLDTTKGKNSHATILEKFANHEADILLGTQMVSKGLDFEGVSLVGVVNADTLIDYPDFRSSEQSFQTLIQVSGRSGRAHKRGTVVIQTSHADYPIINQIIDSDYNAFYDEQIEIRRMFSYPPFCRVVFISLRSKNLSKVQDAASWVVRNLNKCLPGLVYGPEVPPVSKISDYNIRRAMVKIPTAISLSAAKNSIAQVLEDMQAEYPIVSFVIDVDPV